MVAQLVLRTLGLLFACCRIAIVELLSIFCHVALYTESHLLCLLG